MLGQRLARDRFRSGRPVGGPPDPPNVWGLYLNGTAVPQSSGAGRSAEIVWSGRDVTTILRPGANTLAIYCRDTGAFVSGLIFSAAITWSGATVQQRAQLLASGTGSVRQLGNSLAASGDTALVGAWYDPERGQGAGAAYLFDVLTRTEIAKLTASDGVAGDQFGYCVAVNELYALVGAPTHRTHACEHGAAYVFDVLTGQQLFKLTAPGVGWLGASVALQGNLALVGDMGGGSCTYNPPTVRVFDLSARQLVHELVPADWGQGSSGWGFGGAVAASGNIAIVGAPDSGPNHRQGAAYVFDLTTGQQLLRLDPDDAIVGAHFGNAVALDGNVALIGALERYDVELYRSGAAYLFDVTTGQQLHKLVSCDLSRWDWLGCSVALGEHTALVGAYGKDGVGTDSGAAYLFDRETGQQLAKLTAPDTMTQDRYGSSVAYSVQSLLVGVSWDEPEPDDYNAGSVRILDYDLGPPSEVGDLGSTSHTPDVWTPDATVSLAWLPAEDDRAVDGYSAIFDSDPENAAPRVLSLQEADLIYSQTLESSAEGYFFLVRAADEAGNWGTTSSVGPFLIDAVAPSDGTIQIETGAASTASLIVSLDSLGALDPHSGLVTMQFSNDGSTWSPEETVASSRPGWDLSAFGGDRLIGKKTVHVRYRDAAGNLSNIVSDTIDYAPLPEIHAVSPARGQSGGGNTVVISGDGFTADVAIHFDGVPASVKYVSQFELQVVVPGTIQPPPSSGSPLRLAVTVDVDVISSHGEDTETDGYTYLFIR